MPEHLNPDDVYEPYENVYTQVIKSRGQTQVDVAGTVCLAPGRRFVGEGDMAAQVQQVLANLRKSLAAAGAQIEDVVRINIFTTDVDAYLQHATPIAKEFWGTKPPVATLVGVTRLADPRYLVEIEATAILD
jgi:enamine deaminase RidA (YjgF/YER057c/UK114 family)